ncbi:TPA: hypothetical protein ACXN0A_000792 [Pseudomonas aeruginosa]
MSFNGKVLFVFALGMSCLLGMNVARLWEAMSPTHANPAVLGLLIVICSTILCWVGAHFMRHQAPKAVRDGAANVAVVTMAPDLDEALRIDHICPECKGPAVTLKNLMHSFRDQRDGAATVECAGCGVKLVIAQTGSRIAELRVAGRRAK